MSRRSRHPKTHLFDLRVGAAVEHEPRKRAAGAQGVRRGAGGDGAAVDDLVLQCRASRRQKPARDGDGEAGGATGGEGYSCRARP